ncbi:hypothetical protein, partial [Acidocella aquatica]
SACFALFSAEPLRVNQPTEDQPMPASRHELITAFNSSLLSQRYSPVVAMNYCTYASGFLDYLGQRAILIADVIDVQVEQYLRHAIECLNRSVVGVPARVGTRSLAPEFMPCCD